MARLLGGILVVVLLGMVLGQEEGGSSSCSKEISAKEKDIAAVKKQLAEAEERVIELEGESKIIQGQMQQLSTYSETTRGELEVARKKLKSVEEEKAAALASCAAAADEGTTQCKRELDATAGAKQQLEKQLRDEAARVELLNTDIKKHKEEVDAVKKEKKNIEGSSAKNIKKVQDDASATVTELEAMVKALEARIAQQSGIPTWVLGAMKGLPLVNSTFESASVYMKTMGEQPAVRDAIAAGREYYNVAITKASELYVQAQPMIQQASEGSLELAKTAMLKGEEIYTAARPQFMEALSKIESMLNEIVDSKMVTDAKAQTGLILGELKALMKTQMRTIPSLSPYSSDEIVDMIVYGILGLPALLLLSFCGLCCCTRKQNKQPTGDAEEVNASSIRKPGSAGKRKGNKGSKK